MPLVVSPTNVSKADNDSAGECGNRISFNDVVCGIQYGADPLFEGYRRAAVAMRDQGLSVHLTRYS